MLERQAAIIFMLASFANLFTKRLSFSKLLLQRNPRSMLLKMSQNCNPSG